MHSISPKRPLILGAALVAVLTLGGTATALADANPVDSNAADTSAGSAPTTTSTTTDNGPVVEHQKGIVLEGTGKLGRRPVYVSVYENSLYGNTLQILIGDGANRLVGHRQTTRAFVTDGVLDVRVRIDGYVAVLSGTLAETGHPTLINESMNDAGQRIVTKGTNTPLLADVTLTYRGRTARLAIETAFAYDLTVKKVTLYGR